MIIASDRQKAHGLVSANGKPAQSVAIEMQIAPGVVLKEVHEQYVLISDNDVIRRVDLPQMRSNIAANPVRLPTEIIGINPVAPAFPAHQAQPVPPGFQPGRHSGLYRLLFAVMPGAPGAAQ